MNCHAVSNSARKSPPVKGSFLYVDMVFPKVCTSSVPAKLIIGSPLVLVLYHPPLGPTRSLAVSVKVPTFPGVTSTCFRAPSELQDVCVGVDVGFQDTRVMVPETALAPTSGLSLTTHLVILKREYVEAYIPRGPKLLLPVASFIVAGFIKQANSHSICSLPFEPTVPSVVLIFWKTTRLLTPGRRENLRTPLV